MSYIKESKLEKCCETCKFYVYDFSTGQSVCNCPDEYGNEWVRQKEEDIWNVDYDYCDCWEPAPEEPEYESKSITEDSKKKSILVFKFVFDSELDDYSYYKTKEWLESFDLEPWVDYLHLVPETKILNQKLIVTDSDGFILKVYTTLDLEQIPKKEMDDLVHAVERFVFDEIEPQWQEQPFGQIRQNREFYFNPSRTQITDESRALRKSLAERRKHEFRSNRGLREGLEPTESKPLEVDCPRGKYFLWKVGNSIYGSATKPDPRQRIIDAHSIIDFSSQGFETLDDVIEYIKKYF